MRALKIIGSSKLPQHQLIREYHKRKTIPSQKQIIAAKEIALDIFTKFDEHEANHHKLFAYLEKITSSGVGLTAEQYLVYRDNYFYRTANTILSAMMHAVKAVENHDYAALAGAAQVVRDEGGNGDKTKVHLAYLEDSHNIHGRIVFGIPAITIQEAADSPYLTTASMEFRKTQEKLFKSSYPVMTGCLLAHEGAADKMLTQFRKTIFEPYSGYYTKKGFELATEYYTAHRNDLIEGGNVEEQHREQALQIAAEMIAQYPNSKEEILEGGLSFLKAQSDLWQGMMTEMEESKFYGQSVPSKCISFLEEKSRPPISTRDRRINLEVVEDAEKKPSTSVSASAESLLKSSKSNNFGH